MGTCVDIDAVFDGSDSGASPLVCQFDFVAAADQPRIFKGARPRGFEEQDYQCLVCKAKFTHSTNKNDLSWTLWQG